MGNGRASASPAKAQQKRKCLLPKGLRFVAWKWRSREVRRPAQGQVVACTVVGGMGRQRGPSS